jgi:Flp pilus assembly protein TadG
VPGRRRSPNAWIRRFLRHERGATAVEFALVATPFLALLFGIMELGLIFMGSVTLDNATQAAARKIRTGQVVSPGTETGKELSRGAFRDAVCNGMGWMKDDCMANLVVDVRTFTQFQSIAYDDPISNKTFNPGQVTFETGGPSDIVLVRVYYPWKLYVPLMAGALEKTPGKTLLTSITTFRNEPY